MEGCVFFPQESIYSVECDIFSCYTICVLGGHLPALEEHLKSEVKTISVIITISPDDSSTPISHGIFERRTIPKCADTYTHGIFIAFSNGFMKTHQFLHRPWKSEFWRFFKPPKKWLYFLPCQTLRNFVVKKIATRGKLQGNVCILTFNGMFLNCFKSKLAFSSRAVGAIRALQQSTNAKDSWNLLPRPFVVKMGHYD